MSWSGLKRGLLLLVLAGMVSAAGCQKAGQPGVESPPSSPPSATAPQGGESEEGSEAVKAARKLGTPTDNPVVTTQSGLQHIDVKEGEGASAKAGQTAVVHYTGWLVDGTKFDSSLDKPQPFEFPLGAGRVIKGWDEGVAGMKPGGVRKLIVPPELGYGSRGAGNMIPPDATLIFEVQLLETR